MVGVEIVASAIEDAKRNAAENGEDRDPGERRTLDFEDSHSISLLGPFGRHQERGVCGQQG